MTADELRALTAQGPAIIMATREDMLALLDELDDLRSSVIAFGGPWAVEYAKDRGLPKGHLHPTHYDILAKAGARMDSFTRAAEDRE